MSIIRSENGSVPHFSPHFPPRPPFFLLFHSYSSSVTTSSSRSCLSSGCPAQAFVITVSTVSTSSRRNHKTALLPLLGEIGQRTQRSTSRCAKNFASTSARGIFRPDREAISVSTEVARQGQGDKGDKGDGALLGECRFILHPHGGPCRAAGVPVLVASDNVRCSAPRPPRNPHSPTEHLAELPP